MTGGNVVFEEGQRYVLPSGRLVQVMPPLMRGSEDNVPCQYVHPAGRKISWQNEAYALTLTRAWMQRYARRVR